MKVLFAIAILCTSCYSSFAQNADQVIGLYWSPKKNAKIQVYRKGNVYYGKLQWVEKNRKDTENPDASLRSRDLLGMEFMWGFTYDADDNEYTSGKVYDAESGKTYSGKMWMKGKNLKLRGYVGVSLLGRTEEFERIN